MSDNLVIRVRGRKQKMKVLKMCDSLGIRWSSGPRATDFCPLSPSYWFWISDVGITFDGGNKDHPFGNSEGVPRIEASDPTLIDVLTLLRMVDP